MGTSWCCLDQVWLSGNSHSVWDVHDQGLWLLRKPGPGSYQVNHEGQQRWHLRATEFRVIKQGNEHWLWLWGPQHLWAITHPTNISTSSSRRRGHLSPGGSAPWTKRATFTWLKGWDGTATVACYPNFPSRDLLPVSEINWQCLAATTLGFTVASELKPPWITHQNGRGLWRSRSNLSWEGFP